MPKVLASAPNAGGRHRRGRRVAPTLSEINVVPMVDVMLVLLIIFMVAAPMLQRGVEVNLPVASRSQEIASERVFVDVPSSYKEDQRVFIKQEPIRKSAVLQQGRQFFEIFNFYFRRNSLMTSEVFGDITVFIPITALAKRPAASSLVMLFE